MSLLALLRGFFRRRTYGSAFVLLFVLLLAVNYLLWQERAAADVRHEKARQKGDQMLHALAAYPRITADLAAVDDALQVIDRSLLTERTLEVNLGYFYQMEVLSRVRLRQLNQLVVPPSPEGNPFKAIPFSLQATGTYPQLVGFLRNLETGPRLMRIRSYSLERGEAKTGNMRLELVAECLGRP
jgi:Tfp pilus assembly protein PilO